MQLVFAALAGLAATVAALPSIEVQEQEFVDPSTGDRFVIIGIDYAPESYSSAPSDPLTDPSACLRDAALMQQLGVNTIRCYQPNPSLDHNECMSIFNEAGIYVILDVNTGDSSLISDAVAGSYNLGYMTHVFSVISAFKDYPNVLGFFSGNEVIFDTVSSATAPQYIRAVQRDMKQYIAKHASRTIPVGYSAADTQNILDQWLYLTCNDTQSGSDSSRSDFFGLNDYQWCGPTTTFQSSGYAALVQQFQDTSVPVFFSEYGCNKPEPRVFNEVLALYGPEMTVLSGGLVFEWTQATNDFGLTQTYANGSLQLLPDYVELQGKYAQLNDTVIETRNSTATSLQAPVCAAGLISSALSNNFTLPDPPAGVPALIQSGVSGISTGSLVSVTQTSVTDQVFATNGALISGLKLVPVKNANAPGSVSATISTAAATGTPATTAGSSSGSTTGTGTATAATTSSTKGAAPRIDAAQGALAALALGVGVLAL